MFRHALPLVALPNDPVLACVQSERGCLARAAVAERFCGKGVAVRARDGHFCGPRLAGRHVLVESNDLLVNTAPLHPVRATGRGFIPPSLLVIRVVLGLVREHS